MSDVVEHPDSGDFNPLHNAQLPSARFIWDHQVGTAGTILLNPQSAVSVRYTTGWSPAKLETGSRFAAQDCPATSERKKPHALSPAFAKLLPLALR